MDNVIWLNQKEHNEKNAVSIKCFLNIFKIFYKYLLNI